MATFALVHGAWHGGWCWRKVAPLLRQAGHEVHTPTLTGLGDRAHLAQFIEPEQLGLALHIQDVANLLAYEDLRRVILVGHAYAGMVITGVAALCPERLAHLVYINGVVPQDGEAMLDQLGAVRGPEFVARISGAIARGEGFLPPPATVEEISQRWGVADPAELEWMLARVTPHPARSFAEPVSGAGRPEAQAIPRSFILSSESGFGPVAERAEQAGWGLCRLETGHDPMLTMPGEVADFLLRVAGKT